MIELSLFVFLIAFFFYMLPTVRRQLTAMQESDYFYEKYLVFMKGQRKIESMWVMVGFIVASLILPRTLGLPLFLLLHALPLGILCVIHMKKRVPAPKKDGRLSAVCIAGASVFLAILLLLAALFRSTFLWELPFILSFLGFMTDTWILIGNWIVIPFMKRREKASSRIARQKLEAINAQRADRGEAPVKIIGVAGTYGKSAMIAALGKTLALRYRVLTSHAQTLGTLQNACDLITNKLRPEHDILVLEIMARHPGDVERFATVLPIHIGVLTSAAERNLETFLSPDRILSTLAELDGALTLADDEGTPQLVLNYNDEYIRKIKTNRPILRYGSYKNEGSPQHLDIYCRDTELDTEGTHLTLCDKQGIKLPCMLSTLGRYQMETAVGAAGFALSLGVEPKQLVATLKELPASQGYPVLLTKGIWPDSIRRRLAKPWEQDGPLTKQTCPYRILSHENTTSLDGTRDALSLLATYKGYRIVLTRGLSGNGAKDAENNRLFGRQVAKCADALVIVGKENFSTIEDGAQRGGFAMGDIHLSAELSAALERIAILAADVQGEVLVMVLGGF